MKSKTSDYGHLTAVLMDKMPDKMSEESKPSLEIHAHMNSGMYPQEDKKWRKEELKRLRSEVKAISDEISNWDAESVAKRALTSLKTDLAVKKARLMECEALLGDDGEGEEGAEGEGAVVGGPYEIVKDGSKFKVKNMETGDVKGTFSSRREALKQFRLLEGIEHGMVPNKKG